MIRKFLDVSSGHLSVDTWAWLDAQLADEILREPTNTVAAGIAGGRTRYGWFVYAFDEPCISVPGDLARIFRLARTQGAEYVMFDCDAPGIEGLPILHPDFGDPPPQPPSQPEPGQQTLDPR